MLKALRSWYRKQKLKHWNLKIIRLFNKDYCPIDNRHWDDIKSISLEYILLESEHWHNIEGLPKGFAHYLYVNQHKVPPGMALKFLMCGTLGMDWDFYAIRYYKAIMKDAQNG